jgi:hypothetical protein
MAFHWTVAKIKAGFRGSGRRHQRDANLLCSRPLSN